MVKNLPASAGDVGSILVLEDPLKEEIANCSSILAWGVPQTLQARGEDRSLADYSPWVTKSWT